MSQEGQVVSVETDDGRIQFYFIQTPIEDSEDIETNQAVNQLIDGTQQESNDPISVTSGIFSDVETNDLEQLSQQVNVNGNDGIEELEVDDQDLLSGYSVSLSEYVVNHEVVPVKKKKGVERDITVSVSFTDKKFRHNYTLKGRGIFYEKSGSEVEKEMSNSANKKCFLKMDNFLLSMDTGKAEHKCSVCQRVFKYSNHLKNHMEIHAEVKKFTCDICSKEFSHCGNLTSHRKMKHPAASKFHCKSCTKEFSHVVKLQEHETVHSSEKSFACDLCQKRFRVHRNMVRHRTLHDASRSHRCGICQKDFKTAAYLASHVKVHSETKEFKCGMCDVEFRHKSSYTEHIDMVHRGYHPHKCHICDSIFSRKYNLTLHLRTHTDERPYKCQYCIKAFRGSTDLVRHTRKHTGDKPYKCDSCEKCFTQNTSLKAHKKAAHDGGGRLRNNMVGYNDHLTKEANTMVGYNEHLTKEAAATKMQYLQFVQFLPAEDKLP